MDGLFLTRHAAVRMNQRGIRREAVETLLAYGMRRRSHGADVYFMTREARARALGDLGHESFARLERALDAYLVVGDDGAVVTAAKRLRRLRS